MFDRDQHIPAVRERVHRQRRARQHPKGQNKTDRVTQWGGATLSAWSRTQQSVSLSSAEAESYGLTTGIAEGMVTKHLLKELGHDVTLVNHVYSQPAKGVGVQTRVRSDEEVHVRARCHGEEANDTCLCQHEFEQGSLDDKVSHL